MHLQPIPGHNFFIGKKEFNTAEKSAIMGILNITPDSFSDGGQHDTPRAALKHAMEMEKAGAEILDIGGESTRPNHEPVPVKEELARVVPAILLIREQCNLPVSIDTTKPEVAQAAVEAGAVLINDINGLQGDPDIAKIAAEFKTSVCIMHNQNGTDYNCDIIEAIIRFFDRSLDIASKRGIAADKIILDPGIGFGKTPVQNIEVTSRLSEIKEALNFPLLLGTSRKSMIGHILPGTIPDQRVTGTVATTVAGRIQGADIFRVHDVLENAQAAAVTDAMLRSKK